MPQPPIKGLPPTDLKTGKKQKKRLEDAEARAASASHSPQALHQEFESSSSQASDGSVSQEYLATFGHSETRSRYITPELLSSGYYADEFSEDDRQALFTEQYVPDMPASSSQLAYWGYPMSSQAGYPASSEGRTMGPLPSIYGPGSNGYMSNVGMPMQCQSLHARPGTLSASPEARNMSEDQAAIYSEDDLRSAYGMNYASMTNTDPFFSQTDPESNNQVNLSYGRRR